MAPLKQLQEVGENLFIFQFRYEEEREMVVSGGPWHFDDHLVVVKKPDKSDRPGRNPLTKALFWVQIYGLPFLSMTENVGKLIGVKIGRVLEVRTDGVVLE